MILSSAKSWLAVDRDCKFALFTDYIRVKKEHYLVFFISFSKGYVDMTRTKVTLKKFLMFWGIKSNNKYIFNVPSMVKWSIFEWVTF